MKKLSVKEAKKYYGGAGISATFVSAITRGLNFFTDLGRYFGSSIRRIFNNNMCDY